MQKLCAGLTLTLILVASVFIGPIFAQPLSLGSYLPLVFTEPTPIVLQNGGFEAQFRDPIVWTLENGAVIGDDQEHQHSGSRYASLGGATPGTRAIVQQVTVPQDRPYLSYWFTSQSQQQTCTQDVGSVYINDEIVNQQQFCFAKDTPVTVGPSIGGTLYFINQNQVLDLRRFASQTVTLRFQINIRGTERSTWTLDDIAFVAQ